MLPLLFVGIRSGNASKRAAAQRFMQQPFLMKRDTVSGLALSGAGKKSDKKENTP